MWNTPWTSTGAAALWLRLLASSWHHRWRRVGFPPSGTLPRTPFIGTYICLSRFSQNEKTFKYSLLCLFFFFLIKHRTASSFHLQRSYRPRKATEELTHREVLPLPPPALPGDPAPFGMLASSFCHALFMSVLFLLALWCLHHLRPTEREGEEEHHPCPGLPLVYCTSATAFSTSKRPELSSSITPPAPNNPLNAAIFAGAVSLLFVTQVQGIWRVFRKSGIKMLLQLRTDRC